MSKDLISVLVLPLGKLPSVFNKGCNSLIESDFGVNEASCLMLSITSISDFPNYRDTFQSLAKSADEEA